MEIIISKEAIWALKSAFHKEGDFSLRLFPRHGGFGNLHLGCTLGMSAENPKHAIFKKEEEGIIFFIEEADAWFFQNIQVFIDYPSLLQEINFNFLIKEQTSG